MDGFPVVEQLRRDHPKEFKTLTQVPYWVQRVHQSLDNQLSDHQTVVSFSLHNMCVFYLPLLCATIEMRSIPQLMNILTDLFCHTLYGFFNKNTLY